MADVKVTCSGCGAEIQVSEFADTVVCRSCGRSVSPPKLAETAAGGVAAAPAGARAELKFRSERHKASVSHEPSDLREAVGRVKKRKERDAKRGVAWAGSPLLGWIAFLVVGGLGVWARFGTLLTAEQLEMLKHYGPFVALGFHLLVVIKAFEDSVLHGALCVLFPPYAFYYLFASCDVFLLRGLYLGVLGGVGLDTAVVVLDLAHRVSSGVTEWIMSGGG